MVDFNIGPTLNHIESLKFEPNERYLILPDGNVVCAWINQEGNYPRLQLATVRRSRLPLLEVGGELRALGLSAAEGLYEPIHLCFYPKNIVGAEFNFYGPRPSRLASYCFRIAGDICPSFELEPLLRQDVAEQLNDLKKLKVIDLHIRSTYASSLKSADANLSAAFVAAAKVGQPETVHLVLQPDRHQRNSWINGRIPAVRKIATRDDLRENALKFSVSGLTHDNRIEHIDLLKDAFVVSTKIVRIDEFPSAD